MFTQVTDLIPYTNYEFRLKAFRGAVPSNYSNPVFIKTRESLPEKVDKLHGYIWNRTSVVVHWSPASSTNGPDFVRFTKSEVRKTENDDND